MKIKTITFMVALLVCLMASAPARAQSMMYETEDFSQEEILGWLEKNAPEIKDDILAIRDISTDIFLEMMEEAALQVPEMEEMRLTEPKAYEYFLGAEKLEVHSIRLGVELSQETDAKKQKAMKAEIRTLVEKIFKQRMHQLIVQDIERELAELKEMGKVRKANKAKIIERRYNELVDPDSEALEWW